PVVVSDCVLRGTPIGILVRGTSPSVPSLGSCGRVAVRNCLVADCVWGVYLQGAVQRVQVVANRIHGASNSGIILEHPQPATRDLLIANNAIFDCQRGFQFFDDLNKSDRGKGVALCNNLVLACRTDMVFFDSKGTISDIRGPGDGPSLLRCWQITHNW